MTRTLSSRPRAACDRFIPDILEEHLDELGFLWNRRQAALRSPDYTVRAFFELEDRVQAYLDAILVLRDSATRQIENALGDDDDNLRCFAGAFVWLHRQQPLDGEPVLHAFLAADGETREAIRQAMCFGPVDGITGQLTDLFHTAEPALAVSAAEILAYHRRLWVSADAVKPFLADPDAGVRERGWHLVAYTALPIGAEMYAAALRDEDRTVRRAALYAGAWCREPGALAVCRKFAEEPKPENFEALELLAILAEPADFPLMEAVAAAKELGPRRFRVIGSFGSPDFIGMLLEALEDSDPIEAAEAAAAFTHLTGQAIDSDQRAVAPPATGGGLDDFDREFLPEVVVPEPDKARAHWLRMREGLEASRRICRGFDLARGLDREAVLSLDMRSRWEVMLRARFIGMWDGSPLSLVVFPQCR